MEAATCQPYGNHSSDLDPKPLSLRLEFGLLISADMEVRHSWRDRGMGHLTMICRRVRTPLARGQDSNGDPPGRETILIFTMRAHGL